MTYGSLVLHQGVAAWRGHAGARRAAAAALLCAGCVLFACVDAESRLATHLGSARELLAEGNDAEAALELHNALQLSPENAEANNGLGEIAMRAGRFDLAITYIEAAYRADQRDPRSILNLARIMVLQVERLDAAEDLVDRVIAQRPDDAAAYIVRSNLELARGRIPLARAAAERANEIAPLDPDAAWQLGRALTGWIREAQLVGKPTSMEIYDKAAAAFEDYVERGGRDRFSARLEGARVIAAAPRRSAEAGRRYREIVEQMTGEDAPELERAVRTTVDFAAASGDDDLLEWSLSKLIELRPSDLESWTSLSKLQRRIGKSEEAVLLRFIEQRPTDPRSHVEYARYLISIGQIDRAIDLLNEKALEPEQDAPALLGAIVNTQLAAGRADEAERTLQQLEREHPRHPRTVLERAQADLRAGTPGRAARALRMLAEHAPGRDVYRLLAVSEEALGNVEEAITAISRAIDGTPTFVARDETMRLRWLVQIKKWKRVIVLLRRLQEHRELTPRQRLMFAIARYETGRAPLGRALLERLIAEPNPPARAVIEYARREGLDEDRGPRAHAALEQLIARATNDSSAIAEISRIDVANGETDKAIARLDTQLEKGARTRPSLTLLRGQLHASIGNDVAAVRDAREALKHDPRLRGAAEFLASLQLARSERPEALRTLLDAEQAGTLGADGYVKLGNLYRAMGEDLAATRSLEKALALGATLPGLKNDIAFLLAKQHHQLGRALKMAKAARQELDDDPNAVDTLGYVYLQAGSPSQALSLFEDAVARAESPRVGFYYHLGLALQSLDRSEEATRAFETALSISTTFPEAADARRALSGAPSADPS